MSSWIDHRGSVVVVVGGGAGIGAATVRELSQAGATVVVVDPNLDVTGNAGDGAGAEELPVDVVHYQESVTDLRALELILTEVNSKHGRLDAVVNPAGILRFPNYLGASMPDWEAIIDVHLDGYINVLEAALPIMIEAGHGRIVGFVSGAGLARTSPDGPAYGCAKRLVASLTWELADLVPSGVSVNAMSPIAATRMVREGMAALGMDVGAGLDLSAMPQAADMAPAVSYLASSAADWFSGQVIYSAGSEISPVDKPRLLEAVRTRDANFASALGTLSPVVFAPAESSQRTDGGTNPRFGQIFDAVPNGSTFETPEANAGCIVVSDDAAVGRAISDAVSQWGLSPLPLGAWDSPAGGLAAVTNSLSDATEQVHELAESNSIAAVVIALGDFGRTSLGDEIPTWQEVLASHRIVASQVVANACWLRAAVEGANSKLGPQNIVFVTGAADAAGRSASQSIAQMARSVNETAASPEVRAFSIALESTDEADVAPMAQLAARLLAAEDGLALAGAEFLIGEGWAGLRSHPEPRATISFGGPEIPSWVNSALQEALS